MRPRQPGIPVSVDSPRSASLLVDLGLIDYREAYSLQMDLVEKRHRRILERDVILLNEHPSTFTLGRRGGREHLIVSENFLKENNIPLIHIERGGDITYHGEGQLVIYPVVLLRESRISVTEYVTRLEEVMIQLSALFGVQALRDKRNRGVWVEGRKLGSIGIALRHGVSFHGLALNVDVALEPFGWVNPCGLAGVKMTSLSERTGRKIRICDVKKEVGAVIANVFSGKFQSLTKDEFMREYIHV